MILMLGLCNFYFAFTHGYLVKQVFFIISLIVVIVSDLLGV